MDLSTWRTWWRQVGERELRDLTMERWDPIGVAGCLEAADEYDSYLGQIARRLREGASEEELASYLATATDGMGLMRRPAADLSAAREMRRWYDESTARFANRS